MMATKVKRVLVERQPFLLNNTDNLLHKTNANNSKENFKISEIGTTTKDIEENNIETSSTLINQLEAIANAPRLENYLNPGIMVPHSNDRENMTIDNDDDLDLNSGIGCLKNKEQCLLYNGVSINIPRHHILGHIEFYPELEQSLNADSSLNAEKSTYQFVSRYQDLASKLSTFNCKDIHATNCGKNGIVPSHNTGPNDLTTLLKSELKKSSLNDDDFLKIHMESINNKFEKAPQFHSKEHLVTCIFSWLNLPESDRKESSLQIINEKSLNGIQKDANCNDVGSSTLPNLNKLVEKVWEELKVSNISLSDFAKKVVLKDGGKERPEKFELDIVTAINLLLFPLPWALIGPRLRVIYFNIWCWMKLPSIERLRTFNNTSEYKVIDSRFNFPLQMVHEVEKENCSQYSSCYLEEQPINEVIVEDEDLSQFEDTLDSNKNYSVNIDNLSKQKEIDTFLIAKKTLNFMRAHGLTVTEFSEKVILGKRKTVSDYLHQPQPWSRCNQIQREAYSMMADWLCLPKPERISQFTKRVFKRKLKLPNEAKDNVVHELQEHQERFEKDIQFKDTAIRKSSLEIHDGVQQYECNTIDSLEVARQALRFIRESGVSVTEFAEKIAKYQRAHVSLALNHPVPMDKCRNESERDVYRRIASWLKLPDEEKLKKFKRMIKTQKRLNFVKQRFGAPNQDKVASSPNMLKDGPGDSQSIKESSALSTCSNADVTIVEENGSFQSQRCTDSERMEADCPTDSSKVGMMTKNPCERSSRQQVSPNRWKVNSSIAFKKMDENKKKLKINAGLLEEDTNYYTETLKSKQNDDAENNIEVDTTKIAQELHLALAAGKSTIKAFSEAIGINRNYFSNLLRYPVSWKKATKLQKFAFACVNFWLSSMKTLETNPNSENIMRTLPTTNINESITRVLDVHEVDNIIESFSNGGIIPDHSKCEILQNRNQDASLTYTNDNLKTQSSNKMKSRSKQVKKGRSQFNAIQLRSLSEAFEDNKYPSSKERERLANSLGITPRQVLVYFSNHRCRRYLKKTTANI